MKRQIILASASPRRSELLRMMGAEFEVITSDCDEQVPGNPTPAELVGELSIRKAQAVQGRLIAAGGQTAGKGLTGADTDKDGAPIIIGADTVVSLGGRILGKPHGHAAAVEMLTALSGSWHSVFTGIALLCGTEKIVEVCETRVKFTELTRTMCEHYADTGEPLDKAGAYGIQGLGGMFVERIDGDYYNVVGLPISRLYRLLDEHFGVKLL